MFEINQSNILPVAALGVLLSQLACATARREPLPTVEALDLEQHSVDPVT